MSREKNIRVVVGLDFGTTYSGFTYCHELIENKPIEMYTNGHWPGLVLAKNNTVLQYDETFDKVESWGYEALSKCPNRRRIKNERKYIVELFKLHLGNLQPNLKKEYKLSVDYKKAITDYLQQIGNVIKEAVMTHWDEIDFLKNVLLVLTVPAEYSEGAKAIMRRCAYNAGLIDGEDSENLQFTTEPEAAAVYCMDKCLKEHNLVVSGTTFMIVDCGGGTVDLTTRKLLDKNQLSEITERAGDYCGSTFIDAEFIKYLRKKLGNDAIDFLIDNHYWQLQYLVQEFCRKVKFPFTGDDPNFHYEMDLEEVSSVLEQYVSDMVKEKLEDEEWVISFKHETIKSMFDPIIERILRLIRAQLDNSRENCSIMFLVGGFSQSEYLQRRIKEEFRDRVDNISVPPNPYNAISCGAAIYGLSLNGAFKMNGSKCVIDSRVLKFTYGIEVLSSWKPDDLTDRRIYGLRFCRVAKRGQEAKIDEEFTVDGLGPCVPYQTSAVFNIYYTREYEAKFCNEPGMKLLGKLKIDLPDDPDMHHGLDRSLTFKLAFGQMEITATAMNDTNGQNYQTTFEVVDH